MPTPSNEQEEFEFRARAERERGKGKPQSTPSVNDGLKRFREDLYQTPYGMLEAGTNLASRAASGAVGMVAGAAGAVLPGPQGQEKDYWDRAAAMVPEYEPRSRVGKAIVGAGDAALGAYSKHISQPTGQKVYETTGSPRAGALAEGVMEFAPTLLGRGARPLVGERLATKTAEGAAKQSQNVVKDRTLVEAQKIGLNAPATEVESSPVAAGMKLIAGHKTVDEAAQMKHQPIIDAAAREEASLGPNDRIDRVYLKEARHRLAAPYRELAKLSPEANHALTEMNRARDYKNKYEHSFGRTGDVDAWEQAQKYRTEENEWQSLLEKEAVEAKRPDLVPKMRDARVKIAKNHDVENALNHSTGEVDARIIGRMYQADPGRYTGKMETIGRFAGRFEHLVKPNVTEFSAQMHAGTHVGESGLHPYSWISGGIPGIRGPLARGILSDRMQKSTQNYEPGLGLKLTEKMLGSTFDPITNLGGPSFKMPRRPVKEPEARKSYREEPKVDDLPDAPPPEFKDVDTKQEVGGPEFKKLPENQIGVEPSGKPRYKGMPKDESGKAAPASPPVAQSIPPELRELTKPSDAPGKPVNPVAQGLEDMLGKAVRREEQERAGHQILEEMEENSTHPGEVTKQFWTDTYFKLPAQVQQKFQKMLKNLTGMEPGSVISYNSKTGEKVIAKDWQDIAESLDFSPEVGHLEGTERGLVSLMYEANRRFPKKD